MSLAVSVIIIILKTTFLLYGISDVPKLPPLPGADLDEDEVEDPDDEESDLSSQKPKRHITSGPKTPDPYAADESSFLYPILIALAIFIPTLFCLCKL